MKILNEVAIWMVAASIVIECYMNELTVADLIIRVFLIGINAVCYAMLDER